MAADSTQKILERMRDKRATTSPPATTAPAARATAAPAAPAAPARPPTPTVASTGMQPVGTPGTPTGFGQVMQPRASVDEIAADMMKSDSPLMRQAETRGLQMANRRGLLNSSIAVGEAQRAQLDAIVPMASAEADLRDRETQRGFQSSEAQKDRDLQTSLARFDAETRERLQKIDIEARERLARLDIDAGNRRSAEGMISNILSLEQNTLANIMANTNLSKQERQSQIQAAEQRMRSQMDLVEGLFTVDLSEYGIMRPTGGGSPPAPVASGGGGGGQWTRVGGVSSNGWVTERNSATGETRRRQVA